MDNDDQSKAKSPSQIFCEHVTVAGLEDLYTAKVLTIRCLFAVGLVIVALFGLFTSYRTVQESLQETASVNIQFKDDGGMLFPNVTICTTAVGKITAGRELLVVPKKVEEKLKNAYRNKLGSPTKRCKPICQRWQYEPIVGYSELRDINGRTTDSNANISWSRITVSLPSEYYEEYTEEERSGVYVMMCNVGGAMGVCLGLSATTLAQVVAYGLHSCYLFKRNRKRIHPS